MSKIKSFFADVKEHWSVPDSSKGRFVPYKEYLTIFTGVAMNYGVQSPLKYLSCVFNYSPDRHASYLPLEYSRLGSKG